MPILKAKNKKENLRYENEEETESQSREGRGEPNGPWGVRKKSYKYVPKCPGSHKPEQGLAIGPEACVCVK